MNFPSTYNINKKFKEKEYQGHISIRKIGKVHQC